MTVFGWLFLGHFVADWLLQNDWMALGKRDSLFTQPGLAHYTIYTAVILSIFALTAPSYTDFSPLFVVASIVFISHWLIDGTDLAQRWMRCFGQRDQTMVRVIIDQTFHLLVLGMLATWCIRQ